MLPLRKPILLYGSVILILILAWFMPVKLPLTIRITGKIYPAQEWVLFTGPNGELLSRLTDNTSGSTSEFSVIQFERGDAAQVQLSQGFLKSRQVQQGDTAAFIGSHLWELQTAELEGMLNQARANYTLLETPEAAAVLDEARSQLNYARIQWEEQVKRVEHLSQLLEKGLATQTFFDVEQSREKLYFVNISIAEAQLAAVTDGARPEALHAAESEIKSLENQIRSVQRRNAQKAVVVPLSGNRQTPSGCDTLAQVSQPSPNVLVFPLEPDDLPYIRTGQPVRIRSGEDQMITGRITNVDRRIATAAGRELVLVRAVTDSAHTSLITGSVVTGSIDCDPIALQKHIKRFFSI